jgi:molecular chaperone GrpE
MPNDDFRKRIEIDDAEEFEAQAMAAETSATEALSAEELLGELERKLAEERENTLRAVADLQNFRRRAAEERQQQLQFAHEQVLVEILPVLDNFDRATECLVEGEAAQNLYRGVCMIRDQLFQVLVSFGVEVIPAVGECFDPAWHEAIEAVETTEQPEGTIVAEALPGYRLKGRILRPSKVKVAVEPSA